MWQRRNCLGWCSIDDLLLGILWVISLLTFQKILLGEKSKLQGGILNLLSVSVYIYISDMQAFFNDTAVWPLSSDVLQRIWRENAREVLQSFKYFEFQVSDRAVEWSFRLPRISSISFSIELMSRISVLRKLSALKIYGSFLFTIFIL